MQGPPMDEIAPMVVAIVLFVSTAAVLIFRPLTKKLGERLAAGKQQPPPAVDPGELAQLRQALEDTSARLELMEQRLDFTERLLNAPRERAAVPGAGALPPGGAQPAVGVSPPTG